MFPDDLLHVDFFTGVEAVGALGHDLGNALRSIIVAALAGGVGILVGGHRLPPRDDEGRRLSLCGVGGAALPTVDGAAGVGELPLTSSHVAVINAINNACGVRIRHLPALPEKILAEMKK